MPSRSHATLGNTLHRNPVSSFRRFDPMNAWNIRPVLRAFDWKISTYIKNRSDDIQRSELAGDRVESGKVISGVDGVQNRDQIRLIDAKSRLLHRSKDART